MSKGIDNSYKPLISVCEIIGRIGFRGYTRNDIVEDYKGAISLSPANINNNRLSLNNCTYISWEKYYESPEIMIAQNDIIFCKTGSVGKTAIIHHVAYKMTINPQLTIFRSKEVHPSYLYYVIISNRFQKEVNKLKGTGSVSTISQKDLGNIIIPIPTSIVQEEIVKILDSFTNLIDALNEELSLRQKQFEYYREKLLTFDESNYVKISSICKRIVSGGTPKTTIDRYYQGNIPWLRTEEVDFCYVYETKKHISEEAIANSSTKMIPVNCVIIAMYGATAAKCCINKIPLCTNQACCNLEIDDTLALYKFVFYNICKEYEKLKSLGEGSQNNISGQKIKDYRIPIPSLSIQQSIVEKLDAFESLISSLKEEIALRQKQYEYYREKLLTFD